MQESSFSKWLQMQSVRVLLAQVQFLIRIGVGDLTSSFSYAGGYLIVVVEISLRSRFLISSRQQGHTTMPHVVPSNKNKSNHPSPFHHLGASSPVAFASLSSSSSSPSSPKPRSNHHKSKPAGHIPRPLNAFFCFRGWFATTQEGKESLREGGQPKFSKDAGKRWRALSNLEKAPWVSDSKRKKSEHEAMHPDYKFKPVRKRKVEEVKSLVLSEPVQLSFQGIKSVKRRCGEDHSLLSDYLIGQASSSSSTALPSRELSSCTAEPEVRVNLSCVNRTDIALKFSTIASSSYATSPTSSFPGVRATRSQLP
ncbi:hypothetical protein DL96DRAFT_523799 [Flagelloscypha sp. PMI_526]|nr:hypothetical protein DL96DRAFT_523799 [Flagelloscypha sp. PMI_526]